MSCIVMLNKCDKWRMILYVCHPSGKHFYSESSTMLNFFPTNMQEGINILFESLTLINVAHYNGK